MISFIIGPACSGKSTFIKATFPDAVIIDLWDYQKDYRGFNEENMAKSYKETESALKDAIREHSDKQIVLEHTLLKAQRRKPYIDAVRSVTDEPVNCYVMLPDQAVYKQFCMARKIIPNAMEFALLEIPEKEEGFENIFIVRPQHETKNK